MGTEDAKTAPPPKRISPQFGPYLPILKTDDKIIIDQQGADEHFYQSDIPEFGKRLLGEILPSDSILEAPSLLTPLLLKKKTILPPLISKPPSVEASNEADETNNSGEQTDNAPSTDIQVLKVVPASCDGPIVVGSHDPKFRKPEQYIKDAVVANLMSRSRPTDDSPTLSIEDFHKTSAADLLISIGISRVNQFVLEDDMRIIARKMRDGGSGLIPKYESAKNKLAQARNFNSPYEQRHNIRCRQCDYRTDSQLVLDGHLERPHINHQKYFLCNRCNFRTKDIRQIISHNSVVHRNIRFKLDHPLSVHCCRYCSYESNSKRLFTSHVSRCEQTFEPGLVQSVDDDTDYPGLTSKIIDRNDVKIYEATLKSLRLASYNPHHIQITSPANGFIKQQILILPKQLAKAPEPKAAADPYLFFRATDSLGDLTQGMSKRNEPGFGATGSKPNQQEDPNLARMLSSQARTNNLPQNRGSMLQYPTPQSSFNNGFGVAKNGNNIVMPPTTNEKISEPIEIDLTEDEPEQPEAVRKSTFLICEICDVYTENLATLKKHMQTVHKVKIHHKIQQLKRPPLNCQKCNWRFFTDQGLERHLLGSHSLVTTNLQELADTGKDAGRCSICGMRCASNLVLHMKDVHKMVLKPAQLSYKCTVCSATFSLYYLFENHVYQLHADEIKAKKRSQK